MFIYSLLFDIYSLQFVVLFLEVEDKFEVGFYILIFVLQFIDVSKVKNCYYFYVGNGLK